jgi:hypothetical protein
MQISTINQGTHIVNELHYGSRRVKLYDVTNVALNPNIPTGLLSKAWFDVMMYLCRRGRENLRKMTLDTFLVQVDGSGRRYVMQVFFLHT